MIRTQTDAAAMPKMVLPLASIGALLILLLPFHTAQAQEVPAAQGYVQNFIISAYYSPLPGQNRYATGSYAGDIRLNGNGTNGADGTPVYPGMIAAPRTYPFGTKMQIPGVGLVAVHDRGGAIVSKGVRGHAYDRLDIWMGYGDEGLIQALRWGKRTIPVTVYGIDPSLTESVDLPAVTPPPSVTTAPVNSVQTAPVTPTDLPVIRQLALGSQGEDVGRLQELLRNLEFYEGDITSVFDAQTEEAVSRFQIANSIVSNELAHGAGHVGPQTRAILARAIPTAAAEVKEEFFENLEVFGTDLKPGDEGEDVRRLQEELRRIHLLGIEPTGYYGEVTAHAVFKFQQTQSLVSNGDSAGARTFGPKTRSILNRIVAARLRTERVAITAGADL